MQQTLKKHFSLVSSVAFLPDSKQLTSISTDKTVKIWYAALGAVQQNLVNIFILKLSFRTNEAFSTSKERRLVKTQQSEPFVPPSQPQRKYSILITSNWITRNGENLLWLPPEYRARCSDSKDNILVLGHQSGLVTFFRFLPQSEAEIAS